MRMLKTDSRKRSAVGRISRDEGEARLRPFNLPPTTRIGQLLVPRLQVALAIARGHSNREVADLLFLSTKTVEFHLTNVFHKLGINRRTQLATMVAQQANLPLSAAR